MTPSEWVTYIDNVLAENAESATDADVSVATLVHFGKLPEEALGFFSRKTLGEPLAG